MKIHQTLSFIVCCAAPLSQAALLSWTDPSPSALQPFAMQPKTVAALAGNDILVYSHPAQKMSLNTVSGAKNYNAAQFSSSAVVLNVPVQQVADFFKNYKNYVGTFPTLTKATVLESQANIQQIRYNVSIPTPLKILNFNEDVVMQHHYDANGLTTTIIDSPLPIGIGKVQWYALDANHSLVTLTQWADLNTTKGWLVGTILKAMPEAKAGIPYGANSFIMEALKRKFNATPTVKPLAAGAVPQKAMTAPQFQQMIKMSQNSAQPVIFIHDMVGIPYQHGNENLRFTSSYQYYNSPVQKTAAFLNPNVYKILFPNLIKSVESVKTETANDVVIKGGAGLGVISIPFNIRMRLNPLSPQTTDMIAVGGDLKFVRNRMTVIPYGTGSVWQMSATLKVDPNAPFLLRVARSMPYHETLPAATMARVINAQAKAKLGL